MARKSLVLALLLATLTGCAGLNVQWEAHATYNKPTTAPK